MKKLTLILMLLFVGVVNAKKHHNQNQDAQKHDSSYADDGDDDGGDDGGEF